MTEAASSTRGTQSLSVPSDWPGSLMLDEIWLHTRRVLVHKLEERHYWRRNEDIEPRRARRADYGKELHQNLLARSLPVEEYRYFESDAAFGSSVDQLRRKSARCMFFGHDLGTALHRLVSCAAGCLEYPCEGAEQRGAEACAIFNLGIAIFDLVHDELPHLGSSFKTVFDERVLTEALASDEAASALEATIGAVTAPELRVLGRLVVAFIGKLRQAAVDQGSLDAISTLLAAAYAAETAAVDNSSGDVAIATSRAKSTLPFQVFLHIVKVVGDGRAAGEARTFRPAVEKIGEIFWLVDDLADLVKDFQAGSLNSVLATARTDLVEANVRNADDPEYGLLRCILSGHYVEDAVEQIVDTMDSLTSELFVLCENYEVAEAAGNVVRDHVRFWLE